MFNISKYKLFLITKIMNVILKKSENLSITNTLEYKNEKTKFILYIPSITTALLIMISPNYLSMELYCEKKWELLKGDLSDFINFCEEILGERYNNYFNYLLKRKYFTHYIKQFIFNRFFTRQVKKHYNISPEVYKCFLDKEMIYTCAFYDKTNDLYQAQINKYLTIAKRLEFDENKSLRVLNIGCGWGSFERFVTKKYANIDICGLSISKSQIEWAINTTKHELDNKQNERIKFLLEDYLHHNPKKLYDAITVVGMIEHVGLSGYNEFFKKIFSILNVNGHLLVHTIINPASDYPTNKWIDKYIFSGGYIPSIKEMTHHIEKFDFRIKNIFIHDPINYSKTLSAWRNNIYDNKSKLLKIYQEEYGFTISQSENLFRQWEIYFASSQASFSSISRPLQVAQFLLVKTNN